MSFSFARLWRESGGAGTDVFWWFGRLAVCLALLGSGPAIVNGLNGIGNGGMSWTSVARVILLLDMPVDKSTWFGDVGGTVWGNSFKGMHGENANALFMDGHAKSYATSALTPYGTTTNDSHWKCANCNNQQYVSPANQAGQLWMFWGTSYAAADKQ